MYLWKHSKIIAYGVWIAISSQSNEWKLSAGGAEEHKVDPRH
jgi:hypothetical protein